jgi:CheY-like chemotaxis protein
LKVITDGQAAVHFFVEPAQEQGSTLLSLVLLDLNLPGLSGLNVLAKIRSESRMPKIPVIIFSASNQQADIDACYAHGCNGYIVKPGNPDQLKAVMSGVRDFWLRDNRRARIQGPVL